MVYEVFMPALGMTQETGKIISWRKKVGQKVQKTDVIMEVETDKTTMEIEAGEDGVVTNLLAQEGDDVPVGQVVARIRLDGDFDEPDINFKKDDGKILIQSNSLEKQIEKKDNLEGPEKKPEISKKDEILDLPVLKVNRKILASPKAKMLAKREGISLESLRLNRFSEPYHVKDIEKFSKSNLNTSEISGATEKIFSDKTDTDFASLHAEINHKTLTNLLEEIEFLDRAGIVFCAFIAGAYREVQNIKDEDIVVSLDEGLGVCRSFKNPDLEGLLKTSEMEYVPSGNSRIIVRNLINTRLTKGRPVLGQQPEIWINKLQDRENIVLEFSLFYRENMIKTTKAINFLNGIMLRMEIPLYHLIS